MAETKDVLENLRLLKAFQSTLLTSEKKVLTLASVER